MCCAYELLGWHGHLCAVRLCGLYINLTLLVLHCGRRWCCQTVAVVSASFGNGLCEGPACSTWRPLGGVLPACVSAMERSVRPTDADCGALFTVAQRLAMSPSLMGCSAIGWLAALYNSRQFRSCGFCHVSRVDCLCWMELGPYMKGQVPLMVSWGLCCAGFGVKRDQAMYEVCFGGEPQTTV